MNTKAWEWAKKEGIITDESPDLKVDMSLERLVSIVYQVTSKNLQIKP